MMKNNIFALLVTLCYVYAHDTENIENLCVSTDDWECVRNFLANTGQCSKSYHPDGVPLHVEDLYTYIPKVNASLQCKDNEATFSGAKISGFYLNKDTNNVVLTVDFESIVQVSQVTVFSIDRVGKEPLVVQDNVNMTYHDVTITMVIAWSDYIQPDDLSASGYHRQPYPVFVIGPNITGSTNELVQAMYQGILADVPPAIKELWLTKAYYYSCAFLNNLLCNFGYLYNGKINRP